MRETLTHIIGNVRQGKTLLATILALKSKKPIYANYKIYSDKWRPLQLQDLFDIPDNSIIVLDEAYTWIESRSSMRDVNKYVSYLLTQAGKRDLDIITTAQIYKSIDVRFRLLANLIIFTEKLPREDGLFNFRYTFISNNTNKTKQLILTYEKAKKYFDKYNTKEKIYPYEFDKIKFKMLKENPKEYAKLVYSLADKIKYVAYGNGKVTLPKVKYALLKLQLKDENGSYINLPNEVIQYVYFTLRELQNSLGK